MKIFLSVFCLAFTAVCSAQNLTPQELSKKLASMDSALFAVAFTCNPEKVATYFTDDLEFYHDKSGVTKSLTKFIEDLKRNFCSKREFDLRRKVVPGTLKSFPLYDGQGKLYGAVQTGDHRFYEYYPQQKREQLVGQATFSHLWLVSNGEWKISRVLSYDHGAPR